MTENATRTVTRFDIFERKNEEEGDREVVRLFEKRALIGEFDLTDVTRYGEDPESDFDTNDFKAWLEQTPRTLVDAMDYLGEEPADEEEEEEGEESEGGSIVPAKYRIRYGAPQNCGDEIALALTAFVTLPRAKGKQDIDGGLDRAKLRGVAEVNGIGDKLANWEERDLNGGLLRMNTSNVLRGMWRRGEQVTIGDKVWPAREVEKKPRKRSQKKGK